MHMAVRRKGLNRTPTKDTKGTLEMPRKTITTQVNTRTHAPLLLSAAQHYAEAAARYHHSCRAPHPSHLARARFLEVTAHLDNMLSALVLRTTSKRRTMATATDAALIKAAARRLADQFNETRLGPAYSPQAACDQLSHLVFDTLATREAEDSSEALAQADQQPTALAA